MSIRERVGNWIAGTRGSTPAIDFQGNQTQFFGPGVGNQPSHERLLAETFGVPATATRAIANRISSLEPQVKRKQRDSDGTEVDEIIDDHPLKILLDRPHPNFTPRQVFQLTAQWILSVGEAYWIKVGNGFRVPTELHPYPPRQVEPLIRHNVVTAYRITDGNGEVTDHEPDEVVRFFLPDPENPWGSEGYLGPIGVQADAHKFASQHMRAHYQYDANPKLALEAQEGATAFTPEQEARFQELFRQAFQLRGGSAQGAPFVTPTHYKLIQLAMQSGSDIAPLLEHWRDEILMAYGVPRSILGQVVSGDRSSVDTSQYLFDKVAVQPIADLIADGITLQVAPDFGDDIFVDWAPYISDDKEFNLKQEQHDLEHAIRTPNQVREARGDDPVEWGEMPTISSKLGAYTGEPPQDPPDMGSDDEDDDEDVDVDRLERKAHIALRQAARRARRGRAAA